MTLFWWNILHVLNTPIDRSFHDVMREVDKKFKNILFGGKVVVFGWDFRQILHVIPKGARQEIVNAIINSSYIWNYCEVLTLTKNETSKWCITRWYWRKKIVLWLGFGNWWWESWAHKWREYISSNSSWSTYTELRQSCSIYCWQHVSKFVR